MILVLTNVKQGCCIGKYIGGEKPLFFIFMRLRIKAEDGKNREMTEKTPENPFAPPVLRQEWLSIYALAQKIAHQEQCSVYDMELSCHGRNKSLKVFLKKKSLTSHSPQSDLTSVVTSVGVEECARFSHRFISLLDMEDILPRGSYYLEVSSPGLERRLRIPSHFLDVIGKEIFVSLKDSLSVSTSVDSPFSQSVSKEGDSSLSKPSPQPMPTKSNKEKIKNFRCVLTGCSEKDLQVKKGETTFSLPLDKVKKAKLLFAYKRAEKGVKLRKQK